MIATSRGACPVSLTGDRSAGGEEREAAIVFYADQTNSQRSFDFKAYKKGDVIAALQRDFGSKCAYCESDYGAMTPADIEHYRPKGAIQLPDGTRRKPGYYWLASEWSNLLPSCIDCNRSRGHEYDEGHGVTGKANQFPLVDEAKRASLPGGEQHEGPYLLNPTRDDPDEHLEFIDRGVVRATMQNGGESERGKRTIDVVGLQRPLLVNTRRDRLLDVDGIIKRFERAAEQLDADPQNAYAKANLREAITELKAKTQRSAPYAGMARQRARPILESIGINLP